MTSMALSLQLSSAAVACCCSCCGGCGWVEPWDNLDAWTVLDGAPAVDAHRLTGAGLVSRPIAGVFSLSALLYPDATTDSFVLLGASIEGAAGLLIGVSGITAGATVEWTVAGAMGGPIPVTTTAAGVPQLVTIQWNITGLFSGQWSATVGGVTVDGVPAGWLPPDTAYVWLGPQGEPTGAAGPVTAGCTELPPIPFVDGVLSTAPEFYFVLDQTGVEDPVDSSPSARAASLNAPYTWGAAGPITGLTALDLAGGYFTTARVALTGSQSRMAFVKTTATDGPPPVYEGDAPLLVVTYNSDDLGVTLYVDGVLDGSGTMTGVHAAQGGIDRYGRGYNAADTYTGTLGHLAAWSRELTEQEVAALWASV